MTKSFLSLSTCRLRTDEDIPPVTLPPSSGDMLIPNDMLLQTCSTYEVLISHTLHLIAKGVVKTLV